jgi:Lrp/AsnC family leucine-responsive transcriptional regulator
MSLDRAEQSILTQLQTDGRKSNAELAEAAGLSESPCYRRVRALEDSGVIQRYRAQLDQRALGLQVTAFVLVNLDKRDDKQQKAFLHAIDVEPHIVECHAMSGSHDFLVKVVARNMDHFSELAMERILKFPGVTNIESNFSLMAVKEQAPLPVNG